MKKFLLLFVFALTGFIVNSQNCFWAKSAGSNQDEFAYGITTDTNGDVYVTGCFQGNSITFGTTTLINSNPGGYAYFLVKYSAGGQVLWAQGANSGAIGYGVTADDAGYIYVTGTFAAQSITFGTQTLTGNTVSYADVFVVKYDTNGNAIWASGMGGNSYDYGKSIAVDGSGNVYVTGNFYSTSITFGSSIINNGGTNYTDYFIAKFDSNGSPVWAKSAGGTRYEYGNGVTFNNGKIYVTGNFESDSATFGSYTLHNGEPGNAVLFTVSYDVSGNVLWAKEVDGLWGNVEGNGIAHDLSGNIFVTGSNSSYDAVFGNDTLGSLQSGNYDIFIVKYNSSGDVLWAKDAGGTNADYSNAVATDSVGNAFITGYYNSTKIIFDDDTLTSSTSNSTPEIFIAKYDSAGNMIWAKSAGGTSSDISYGIATGSDDNVYFTGLFHGTATFGDVTLTSTTNTDMFVADIYNFNSGIISYTDATCNGTGNGTAFTTASGGNLPYTYLWSTVPPETTSFVTDLPAGNFTVTITEAYGCAQTHAVTINEPPADSAKICMVTVDSMSMYNIIVWDKTPYTRVDSFIVYREISTNNYQPIARIPYAAPGEFIDTVRTKYFPNTGSPNDGTYRYKILLHDTCGAYGELSHYHNTIYFLNNAGNFYWTTPYTIENESNPVSSYVLMRDDNSTGAWQDVSSVAGTQQVVSDPLYVIYQNTASWRVRTVWGITCSASLKENATDFSTSLSNIFSNNIVVGTNENLLNDFVNIYPNPANDKIEISLPEKSEIEILNIQGQLMKRIVASGATTNIDVSTFAKGMYFVKVKTEKALPAGRQGIAVRKFIKG